ncbi:DUF357 domain-containing protein [Candidatus Micrarchaeota archaeon]|nr:DUF357 domain-containing protein [Candidatus Micrarchaeota archaeon]
MDEKDRVLKDIQKLERIIEVFKNFGLANKYPQILDYASNYYDDSKHFFDKGDYFTSFAAANYAYGFIDAILLIEGKKEETHA